jgi:hypothetical protein
MSSEHARRAAIAEALHSASIKLLRMVRAEDAASGIGPAQLPALSVLVFLGEKTVGELAALEQVRAPTMSRIADGSNVSWCSEMPHRRIGERSDCLRPRRGASYSSPVEIAAYGRSLGDALSYALHSCFINTNYCG